MSEQMTQYQKDLVRMWDSLRTENKGAPNCGSVLCAKCPFYRVVCTSNCYTGVSFNAEKAIEIANDWAKEHPVKTNADKFKEAWGCEPKNRDDMYYCPRPFGKPDCSGTPDEDMSCEECRKAFWEAEYVEPKAERKQS